MSEQGVETEVLEIEIDEDRIVGYLVDEEDNEIGVLYTDDEGNEVELYYDEIEEQPAEAEDESVEMEIDPDAILYYFVDAKGNELGFAALNEDGEKEEYLYPKDAVEKFYLLTELEQKLRKATGVKGAAGSLVSAGTNAVGGVVNKVTGKEVVKTTEVDRSDDDSVTREDFADMFSTFKEVAIGGYAAISGVMDQVDDVRDSLDEINPKKRRQNRRAKKAAEANAQPMVVQQVVTPAETPAAAKTPAAAEAPAEQPAAQEPAAAPAEAPVAQEPAAAPAEAPTAAE